MEEEKVIKKTNTKNNNLKNKKTGKQNIEKSSSKGKLNKIKSSTIKIKPKAVPKKEKTNDNVDSKNDTLLIEVVKDKEKKQTKTTKTKPKTIKTPNNIVRKIPKEEKKEEIKQQDISIIEKQKKENEIESVKTIIKSKKEIEKENKKKEKEIEKAKKKRQKELEKAKKKKQKEQDKEKKKKEKENKKKEKQSKIKINLPKEWKSINSKNNNVSKKDAKADTPTSFKGKLRSSIFESIDEKELKEQKRKSKEKLKRNLIIFLIIIITIGVILYVLLKYNDYVRKQLAVYESYRIGDRAQLKNESIWYVVEDSDSKTDTIKLFIPSILDVNNDGAINDLDKIKYNTTNKAEYDETNENSVAFILNDSIKPRIEEKNGKLESIDILTAKEYVKIRDRMNYGDEWSNQNWLAGPGYPRWWIKSEQNSKVYTVTTKGTFILSSANSSQFVRPTIVIKKDQVTKIKEKKKITIDLTKGLKR